MSGDTGKELPFGQQESPVVRWQNRYNALGVAETYAKPEDQKGMENLLAEVKDKLQRAFGGGPKTGVIGSEAWLKDIQKKYDLEHKRDAAERRFSKSLDLMDDKGHVYYRELTEAKGDFRQAKAQLGNKYSGDVHEPTFTEMIQTAKGQLKALESAWQVLQEQQKLQWRDKGKVDHLESLKPPLIQWQEEINSRTKEFQAEEARGIQAFKEGIAEFMKGEPEAVRLATLQTGIESIGKKLALGKVSLEEQRLLRGQIESNQKKIADITRELEQRFAERLRISPPK